MTAWRTRKFWLTAGATACAMPLSGCGILPGTGDGAKDPMVVMTWAPMNTDSVDMAGMPAMAEAFARHVNETGGINGRELKVLTCDEQNDTTGATKCARQAEREGAVAVVGSYSQYDGSFMSTLEAGGIPYVGGYGIAQDEFDSPLSYPVNGGLPALLAGSGLQLAELCDDVTLTRPDTAAGDKFPNFLDAGLAVRGKETRTDLRAAENATDYTGIARQGVGGDSPGHCVAVVLGDRTGTYFDSYRRLDPHPEEVTLSSVVGSIQQSLVDRTGGRKSPLEGAYATGWYPVTSDPRWDTMKDVISKYAFGDDRIDAADPGVQTTWVAYTAFTEVVRRMGDAAIDARAVKRTLDSTRDVGTGGLTPELGWRYEDMAAVRDYPRMVNGTITYQVVRQGRLVQTREEFIDVTETLTRAPRT